MMPTCSAMVTIITAAEKEYSTKRNQDATLELTTGVVSSPPPAWSRPLLLPRWKHRRLLWNRTTPSMSAAAPWKAKDSAKKETMSHWRLSTSPESLHAGTTV
jgi:hypothetical protein